MDNSTAERQHQNLSDLSDADEQPQADASAWIRYAHELVAWALRLVNRTDVYGAYRSMEDRAKVGTKSYTAPRCKQNRRPGIVGEDLLLGHFTATVPEKLVGLHTTAPDNTSRFGVVEVDAHGDYDPEVHERNERYAIHLYRTLAENSYHSILTDSDGKGGYHVRIPFAAPAPTPALFHFLGTLTEDYKDFGLTERPERFPKQSKLDPVACPYGNWVRLPGRHHTREQWAKVFDGTAWASGDAAIGVILGTPFNPPCLLPDPPPAPAPPRPILNLTTAANVDHAERIRRCAKYLDRIPPSVSGEHGHDRLLHAACLCLRFGLDDRNALDLLSHFNRRAVPPWSDPEIERKLREAHRKVKDFGSMLADRDKSVNFTALFRPARRVVLIGGGA